MDEWVRLTRDQRKARQAGINEASWSEYGKVLGWGVKRQRLSEDRPRSFQLCMTHTG
jgi:hypothetical protein